MFGSHKWRDAIWCFSCTVYNKVIGLLSNYIQSSDISWLLIFSLTILFSGIVLWVVDYFQNLFQVIRYSIKYKLYIKDVYSKYYKLYTIKHAVKSSPFDTLTVDAFLQQIPVMITLENDKVYVGLPEHFCEPESKNPLEQEEIRISPLLSGHRTHYQKKIVFDHNYSVIEDNANPLSIVIPRHRIVSISNFDFKVYLVINGISDPVVASS